jgi:hypothetical protein
MGFKFQITSNQVSDSRIRKLNTADTDVPLDTNLGQFYPPPNITRYFPDIQVNAIFVCLPPFST